MKKRKGKKSTQQNSDLKKQSNNMILYPISQEVLEQDDELRAIYLTKKQYPEQGSQNLPLD
jgi:hypothetical protein